MKKIILHSFLVLSLVFVGAGCQETNTTNSSNDNATENFTNESVQKNGDEVEVAITGNDFSFTPKEVRVKQGDTVRLNFQNAKGFHNWTVDEFDVQTPTIGTGQEQTIEFIANKRGTFEYYCGVAGHREQGMVGKLIVK